MMCKLVKDKFISQGTLDKIHILSIKKAHATLPSNENIAIDCSINIIFISAIILGLPESVKEL